MAKTVVSIRMPQSLIKQLKGHAKNQHFLDVSELVRSIVRQRFLKAMDPVAYEVQSLRNDLQKEFSTNVSATQKKWLVDQLQQLKQFVEEKDEE